jgi:hypothetical protein
MTLDEFKLKVFTEKETCEVLLEKYTNIRDNSAVTEEEHQNAKRKSEILDGKLDLMKWILKELDKVEIHKPKMREFL